MEGRSKLPTWSSAAKFDTEHKHAGAEQHVTISQAFRMTVSSINNL